jgi:hypothetical protein
LTLFVFYNLSVYGTPVAFGYDYEVEERFQAIMGLGVMGIRLPTMGAAYHITFDPRFGVFWLSPVLLLAVGGYWVAVKNRSHLAEAALSAFAIAVMFGMNAASFLWYGGSTFGPRLIIPALPFFVVPLALLPEMLALPLALLSVVSAAQMLIPMFGQIQYLRLEFKPDRGGFYVAGAPFRGFSLLYQYGLPKALELARTGQSPWTLGSGLGLSPLLSLITLLTAQTGLVAALRRRSLRLVSNTPGPPP